jgi:hypothetical protein
MGSTLGPSQIVSVSLEEEEETLWWGHTEKRSAGDMLRRCENPPASQGDTINPILITPNLDLQPQDL